MAQAFLNALIRASIISLIAIGLTMSFKMLKFANFAHVELAALGAYLAYFLSQVGINLYFSIILSIIMTGLINILIDNFTFRRMRKASDVTLMITSFGLGIVIQNVIRAIWGVGIRSYPIGLQRPVSFLGMRITRVQIAIIILALLSIVFFHLLLHKTRLGKAIRAIADNPTLAQSSAINTEAVIKWVLFITGGMAAVGGIMLALDTHIHPRMGFAIIIPVFAAIILGGVGNPYGAMLGAFVIGVVENVGLYLNWGNVITLFGFFGELDYYIPTGYRYALGFLAMIIALIFFPSGLMGERGD